MAARPGALLTAQGDGRALSFSCGEQAACSRLWRESAELKQVSGLAMQSGRPTEVMTVTSAQPPGQSKKGQAISIELLWRAFFSDPSQWWDNRFEKKNSRSPDFRHKRTKEVLWIESWSNPPWVESELAALIQDRAQPSTGYNVDVHHGAPDQFYNGMAGFNQAQLVTVHQIGGTSTSVDRRSREDVNRNSSGTRGYVRTLCKPGRLKETLHILNQQGIQADFSTYVCLLQECIKMKDLAGGKQVHSHIMESGFKPNMLVLNNLVNMYAKCGSLVDARQVFTEMCDRDMFTWTIMIAGYAKRGFGMEALDIYEQMQNEGETPDRVTFICVLNACASLGALEKGKQVHADIIKSGIASYINLETALIYMYAKCGSMKDAHQVFANMAERNVVSWNAMIAGYSKHGCGMEVFEVYEQMLRDGVMPDRVTFTCILNRCASLRAVEKGREVHADIIKAGVAIDTILETALADMYAKCGSMDDSRQVFDNMSKRDVVSWSVMIGGYAQHGCGREAFEMYEQMQQKGVTHDKVTFSCILNACVSLRDLEKGKQVHAHMIKAGVAQDVILETALADMYAKCGSMKDAHQVFDNMVKRDVVAWSALIAGYAQHGCGKEAFQVYEQMQREGVTPDRVTFICILNACSSLGALEKGKEVHADIVKAGIVAYIHLENALVNMYAKCGSVIDARQVFDNMAERDVVSWSVMIAGYAQHGCVREVLELFEQMQQEGLKPDGITFISLLSACSHAGLVDEGHYYFNSMSVDHGLTPTVEHFGCMADLLGRAGRLDEAQNFINDMPFEPDALVWRALLCACRIHG